MGNDFDEAASSCEGDSGSPVIRRVSETSRGKPYYQQEYVVSTGLDCNLKATIYARVSSREILTWIQQTTDTSPLVAVIGGFSEFNWKKKKVVPKEIPGPITHIEIVSPNKKCNLGIAPVDLGAQLSICDPFCEKKYPNGPPPGEQPCCQVISKADVLGHTGQFSKDAPIFCENCF